MKKFFIFSIFIISVMLISGCVEFPEKTTSIKNQPNNIPTEKVTTNQNQQKIKQEVKAPQETLNSMNQNVNVDYLSYKLTKAETFTEMGTSMFNKQTTGKFVKIYLEITNNAKETKQIFTPRFTLLDNQDRQFDRISDDMIYIADYLEFGKQLQPSLSTSGAIVFELPKDSADLVLIIKGDFSSTSKVKIAISNIQDIGKDTTQKDKQDKMLSETMKESEAKTQELMNRCNTPFSCSSSCPDMMDVGQKNCASGQLCCMQS